MNRFAAWEARNTAKFAQDCARALSEQDELIKSLREDLKTAIRAYRHLIIESEKNDLSVNTNKRFQVEQRG